MIISFSNFIQQTSSNKYFGDEDKESYDKDYIISPFDIDYLVEVFILFED